MTGKNIFRFFVRPVLIFLLGLFLLELFLQFSSDSQTTKYNYAIRSFEQFISSLQRHGIPPASLYFVGDSTIFGSGATVPHLYSLPAQLERLMREIYPDFKIVNLGYPATCTEDHLRVMSLVPDGSTILYRGGISDAWNKGGQFRFMFFGMPIEFKTLKMLYMLLAPVFIKDADIRSVNVQRRLKTLLDKKGFKLFTVDYTIGSDFPFLYTEDPRVKAIRLRILLEKAGFFADGDLKKEYVSMNTRNHPNDLGHYLEAIFVFNYFCREGLFGLSPEKELPLSRLSDFSSNLFASYEEMKAQLRALTKNDFRQGLGHLYSLLPQIISMSSLLGYQQSSDPAVYARENEMLEKLSLLILHDPSRITTYLMSSQNEHVIRVSGQKPDLHKMELYHAVLSATTDPSQAQWNHVHESMRTSALPLKIRNVSYLPNISPYPLEFCPRFVQESGFDLQEISVRAEWEHFFSVPFDFFLEDHRHEAVCNI